VSEECDYLPIFTYRCITDLSDVVLPEKNLPALLSLEIFQ